MKRTKRIPDRTDRVYAARVRAGSFAVAVVAVLAIAPMPAGVASGQSCCPARQVQAALLRGRVVALEAVTGEERRDLVLEQVSI